MAVLSVATEKAIRSWLVRFTKLTTNVYGLDKVFRLIVYTLTLVAASLAKRNPTSPHLATLKALAGPLTDARITMRVLSTLPSIEYAWGNEYNPTALDRTQNLLMLIYAPAELMYWLSAHNIIKISALANDRWSRASCMAWAGWIVLELVTIVRGLRAARQETRAVGADRAKARARLKDLELRLVAQLADLPMAIHWSLPTYPMPQWWVGFFGVLGGVAGYIRMWKATA
ncbi:hypothetical protein GGF32_004267 [Allomyces javanicus]|nr:hypothetical protein GGF32_004267 [Allomyces javanicus]